MAANGWDDSPISVPRMCMELYEQIRGEDWSMVSGAAFQSHLPQALWTADKHYQYIGAQGAAGIGYMAPARRARESEALPPECQHRG
jgi:hypothetical protein